MNEQKAKCTADKRNRYRIRVAVRSAMLQRFRDKQHPGSRVSLLTDEDLVSLSEWAASALMGSDRIEIVLKRRS